MSVLLAIDVLGIQDFIYQSNRLKDVVGASRLVELVTSDERPGGWLADIEAKVVMAAGGNALLLFEDGPDDEASTAARDFAGRYTRKLLEEVPGLEVAICHEPLEGGFRESLERLHFKLARQKVGRLPSVPLLGMSVEELCRETGLPATQFDRASNEPVSATISARRAEHIRAQAMERWQSLLPAAEAWREWQFPDEIENMGGTHGDKSAIGVVHIDLNGMGNHIKMWLSRQKDEDLPVRYRELSSAIAAHVQDAFKVGLKLVLEKLNGGDLNGRHLSFKLAPNGADSYWLPLRPVVLGGDDITFICDARIALELTAEILGQLQRKPIEILGYCVYASAGVAIVNSHFPFSRAYSTAEEACLDAKRFARDLLQTGIPDSVINWELVQGGLSFTEDPTPTCRPYPLTSKWNDEEGVDYLYLGWDWLSGTLLGSDGFRSTTWQRSRNKLKGLQDALYTEPVADNGHERSLVQNYLSSWNALRRDRAPLQLPPPLGDLGWLQTGLLESAWHTPLADALALLDLHAGLGESP